MNIYTVSFFGHKEIENPTEIENRLEKIIHDLVMQKEYIEFLIGRDGEFDLLAIRHKACNRKPRLRQHVICSRFAVP